jgi:hypothetical protein
VGDLFSIRGKIAVVTGGSRGIGYMNRQRVPEGGRGPGVHLRAARRGVRCAGAYLTGVVIRSPAA